MGRIIGPKGFAGIFFALVSEFPLNCKSSSYVSIPALQLCLSQMISLKRNDGLWLVLSAEASTDSFFPTVNILVSLLFSESLIWWGKCPNKDKETVNCFKSCIGKNVQTLVGQLLPLVPCILSVSWSWEQSGHLGFMSSSEFPSMKNLDIHTKCGCLTSAESLYGQGLYMRWLFWKIVVELLSCVWLFLIPWNVACKAPLFMEFPRQEYWSGLPFPFQGDLPNPGIKPTSPALAGGFLVLSQQLIPLCKFVFALLPGTCQKETWWSKDNLSLQHTFKSIAQCFVIIDWVFLDNPSAPCQKQCGTRYNTAICVKFVHLS